MRIREQRNSGRSLRLQATWTFHSAVAGGEKEECGLLIDAVFGVGLSRPVEGDYRQCIEMLASKSIRSTVAVDVLPAFMGIRELSWA